MIHLTHLVLGLLLVALQCPSLSGAFTIPQSALRESVGQRTAVKPRLSTHIQESTYYVSLPSVSGTSLFVSGSPTQTTTTDTNGDEEEADKIPRRRIRDLDEYSSISRRILLAVPLFASFLVVLVVKILTDFVVAPLVLLLRILRRSRRKFLRRWKRKNSTSSKPAVAAAVTESESSQPPSLP